MAEKNKEFGISKRLYSDLGQMFASNPIIRTKLVNKNVSMRGSAMKVLKDVSTFYMTMMANQSYDRFARYADYCIAGDTIIATPEFECGYATIEQLLEKYPNGERFLVYGYNSETQKIEITYAHHPRYVKTDKVIDIILDDDSKITTTPDHRFMKRDGEYIQAQDLEVGQSLMPFNCENSYVKIILDNNCVRKVYNLTTDLGNFAVLTKIENCKHSGVLVKNCEMESLGELSAALNIYADECTTLDEQGRMIVVKTDDKKIQKILEEFFVSTLNVNTNLWHWTRNMCKYGDYFMLNNIIEGEGIVNTLMMPVNEVIREEGFNKDNPFAVRYRWQTRGNSDIEPFEISHFRLTGRENFLPYGQSVIEPARRPWRQLVLLEDSMLVYRIVRAPERRVFNIEMGAASPEEEPLIVEKFKSNVTQQNIVDGMGRVEQRFNPMDMATDYYVPMRGGIGSKIEMLPGGAFNGDIDDVEYIQKKLIASLHIPRAFLGFEEALCARNDSVISVLDGRKITPPEIEKDLLDGKKVYVYSSAEDGTPKVGEITWCGKTKIADKLYKITFDNGKTFECTDNHPLMMRDGSYKRADQIQPGDSCMPLYDRLAGEKCFCKGYKQIYNNKKGRWEYVHRMVAGQVFGEENIKDMIVHHKDYNKFNNNPENLQLMTLSEHMSLHAKLAKNLLTEESRDKLREVMATPEYREKTSESAKKSWEGRNDRRQIIAENNVKYGKREKMLAAYYKKYEEDPNWMKRIQAERKIERPKLEKMIELVSESCLSLQQISKISNCSPQYVLEVVRENGYSGWLDFCKKNGVQRMKKCYSFNLQELKDIASQCATKNEFYNKSGGSRTSIESFFKKQGIDFDNWFKNRNFNHKVISVEIVDYNDWVWDLHVPGYNNFALEAGVFVHNSGKATLAQEDIRWGRTVQRVQRALIGELTRLAMIHLYSKGITNEDDLMNFELSLTNPSNLSILQRMEVWGKKLEVSRAALESGLPNQWVQEQLFGFTREEFENNKKQRLDDAAFEARIEKAKTGEVETAPEEEQQADESFEQPKLSGVGTEDLYKHTGLGKYEEETGLNYVLHDIIDPLKERKERILNNKTILKELKESGSLDKMIYKFTTPRSVLCEIVNKQSKCGNGDCMTGDSETKKFSKFIK